MNLAVAVALLLLLGLLILVSYVDRVYQEIGKFLSREFQSNIDIFEQKIEPKLRVSRSEQPLFLAAFAPRAPAFALLGSGDASFEKLERLLCALDRRLGFLGFRLLRGGLGFGHDLQALEVFFLALGDDRLARDRAPYDLLQLIDRARFFLGHANPPLLRFTLVFAHVPLGFARAEKSRAL